jgi:hypothetical protein
MGLMNETTTSVDRNGNLSIIGTANFRGTLLELRELIDNTISEYGEKTECELSTYSNKSFQGSHIILNEKNKYE